MLDALSSANADEDACIMMRTTPFRGHFNTTDCEQEQLSGVWQLSLAF
jgi:hypothetical protein